MRNKQNFIDDVEKIIKEEVYQTDSFDIIQDAAHTLQHSVELKYVLPKDFTTTGKDEVFIFDIEPRPMTDNPEEDMDDFFYKGKED